ncbi:hypothetical protein M427DRAFT_35973 [Gonapodya prolifera JEL478]|uniref:Restriction of telomere capping protein 5 n=1 Tax=Gonapodya prolifera (strain JEL478) TaxID=1344416 RepID=A0A139A4L2_GONPJ|nr:hypothetical protein M427DRAFT_35973 [Gonapodya prolifera JEL478]|eukprot:KXS11303.1 hypothetical protein M427DRAFT_35973 [Gonapodya prolifera JEL478]
MLDAFSHSIGLSSNRANPQQTHSDSRNTRNPQTRRMSSSQLELEDVGTQVITSNSGANGVQLLTEIEKRQVLNFHTAKRVATQRRKTMGAPTVVVLSEKVSSEQPGDEKCVIPRADLIKMFEVLANLRVNKFAILNEQYGRLPHNPSGATVPALKHLALNVPGTSNAETAPSTEPPGSYFPPDAIERTVDQVFRYTGNGMVSRNGAPSSFADSDTLKLQHLREWVAMQAQHLPTGLGTFLRDTCTTLFGVPDNDLRSKGNAIAFDPNASATLVANVALNISAEPVLPVIWCLDAVTAILNPFITWQLSTFVPESAAKKSYRHSSQNLQALWKLTYSGNHHGFSLQMFKDHVFKSATPTVMLIKCKANKSLTVGTVASEELIIGAYIPTIWEELKTGFFGSEESFIFELQPYFEVFHSTMQSTQYAHFGPHGISFGGGATHDSIKESRILLDETLQSGYYQQYPIQVSTPPTYAFSRTRGAASNARTAEHLVKDFVVPFEVTALEVFAISGTDIHLLQEESMNSSGLPSGKAIKRRKSSSYTSGQFLQDPTMKDAEFIQLMQEMDETLNGKK